MLNIFNQSKCLKKQCGVRFTLNNLYRTVPGADVINKKLEQHYAEIKHSDWSKIIMGLETANQSALFQHSVVTLLQICLWHWLQESRRFLYLNLREIVNCKVLKQKNKKVDSTRWEIIAFCEIGVSVCTIYKLRCFCYGKIFEIEALVKGLGRYKWQAVFAHSVGWRPHTFSMLNNQ